MTVATRQSATLVSCTPGSTSGFGLWVFSLVLGKKSGKGTCEFETGDDNRPPTVAMHALARHVLVCAVYVLASCSGALASSSSAEAQEAYLIHVHRQPSILGAVGRPLVSRQV